MNQFDFSKIDFNSGLLIKEMIQRGIHVSYLGDTSIVVAKYGEHKEYLQETNMNIMGYMTKFLLDNKYTTKLLLQESGFSVVEGKRFSINEFKEAIEYGTQLGFPLVIKPTMGAHGTQVHINIQSISEFISSFHEVKKHIKHSYYNDILVEKYFEGNEYRIFITKNNFIAAIHREPANITGDGQSTIEELIEKENYRRMNPRQGALCTIKINQITHNYLAKHGKSVQTIPEKGEKIYVRKNSNVCTGGNCRDITDQLHPSVINITKDILHSLPNMPYMGIDFMTKDITQSQDKNSYMICEINANPGYSLHTHEETGNFRDAPSAVVDILFPETIT